VLFSSEQESGFQLRRSTPRVKTVMESGNGIFGYLGFLKIIVPSGVVNWYWAFFFSNCLLVSNARYRCLGYSVVP
jgi:hypothetical protein